MISMQGKTNFFEKRVGEYQKAGVMGSSSPSGTTTLLYGGRLLNRPRPTTDAARSQGNESGGQENGSTSSKEEREKEDVRFDAIQEKLSKLSEGLNQDWVDPGLVAKLVIEGLYDGVTTSELDELSAETAASLAAQHPDYSKLAARICVDNLHRSTKNVFSEVVSDLRNYMDPESGKHAPLISEEIYEIIMNNKDVLDTHIDYDRDHNYDYFGFKTLERSYLLKLDGQVAERPQHMLMRVAVGIHHDNIEKALETYDLMSQGWFTHATPTLFNSGTPTSTDVILFLAYNDRRFSRRDI